MGHHFSKRVGDVDPGSVVDLLTSHHSHHGVSGYSKLINGLRAAASGAFCMLTSKLTVHMLKMYCKEGTSVVLWSTTLHSFIHSFMNGKFMVKKQERQNIFPSAGAGALTSKCTLPPGSAIHEKNCGRRDPTLSSVYVTTESHDMRMRVADQCAYNIVSEFCLFSRVIFNIITLFL